MIAEILSTGDEIRSGAIVDTNTAYIARELGRVGINVRRHVCVGDDKRVLCDVLKEISGRADLVIVTGGLGPTDDDVTTEAAADAAGVALVENDTALEMVKAFFQSRHREMNPFGQKMALLPKGSEIIKNRSGAAPGFILEIKKCRFYFLPGVPFEMEIMMAEEVLPHILKQKDSETGFFPVRTLSSFGVPESQANGLLKEFGAKFPEIALGFRAIFPEVHIKLYGKGTDKHEIEQKMAAATKWVADILGDHVLSLSGDSMESALGKLLNRQNATIAVAESCTGGLISSRLTDVAGSSNYFLLSAVTYANEAKVNVLGVSPETLETFGAVHEETAKQMALGVQRLANATYGISTTGIAGPDGGTSEKPVGTVCIGIATPRSVKGYRFCFSYQDRARNKYMFATKAMDLLRRELIGK